jgi:hypothetical protein
MSTPPDLYEQDFHLWCLHTCAALGAREFDALDLPHLIEEIRALAGRDRRELASRLATLMMHLLKWAYQPLERSGSWRGTMRRERTEIAALLEQSPSLARWIKGDIASRYQGAREEAADETGLALSTFPDTCPWAAEQVLDQSFWPGGEEPR